MASPRVGTIPTAVLVVIGCAVAHANDPEPTAPPAPPPAGDAPAPNPPATEAPASDERSAADVAGAPRPGHESGRIDEHTNDASSARWFGRGMLAIPRVAFELAFAPVRASVWAYERFRLRERWYQTFFNKRRTVGVYPILRFDSGFGFNGGGRLVVNNLLGAREQVAVRAATGGQFREIVSGVARSGDRFDRLAFELAAEYERRPQDQFFGIGNADEMPASELVDPLSSDAAVSTRYRQQLVRASLGLDVRLVSDLHVRTAGALTELEFGPSDEATSIDEVYMTERLVGFGGLRHAYGEVELLWDSRGHYSKWERRSIHSTGWLASVYAGRVAVEDGPDFSRLGVDTQHFWRVGAGPRVIATRLHAEAVTGRIEDVPFDELPKLGGLSLLRGFPIDRFRDRVAVHGSVEYRWDVAPFLVANIFTDAGQVARSVDAVTVSDMRFGYGIGLDWYSPTGFVARAYVASSLEGDALFTIAFDPAFNLDPRVVRR